ncbi:hypothetical protein PS664_01102 [Pseudomonas fluorescens]|nr:hypothetical protein PS664_01102 [Pseudomonas fluorescens]
MARSEFLEQGWTCTLLALMAVFTSHTDSTWIDDTSSNRNRVFS